MTHLFKLTEHPQRTIVVVDVHFRLVGIDRYYVPTVFFDDIIRCPKKHIKKLDSFIENLQASHPKAKVDQSVYYRKTIVLHKPGEQQFDIPR